MAVLLYQSRILHKVQQPEIGYYNSTIIGIKLCLNFLLNDTFNVCDNWACFVQSFNLQIFAFRLTKIVDTIYENLQ